MAKENKSSKASEEHVPDIHRIKLQMDVFDQRLDNIDSIVSAVAERVMSQLISLDLVCPHCGKNIEIAIVSASKPKR